MHFSSVRECLCFLEMDADVFLVMKYLGMMSTTFFSNGRERETEGEGEVQSVSSW